MWLVFAISFLYFLPFFVGLFRAHPHPILLFAANAGLGWTGWGWVVSFVYALWTFAGALEPSATTESEPLEEPHDDDPEPFNMTEIMRLNRLRDRTRGRVIEFPALKYRRAQAER